MRAIVALGLLGSSITVASPVLAGTISYSYDRLGRLTQAVYPGGAVVRYHYDANGNRTSYVVTGSGNPPPGGTSPVGQAAIAPADASGAGKTDRSSSSPTAN